jgi:hypothetical protein
VCARSNRLMGWSPTALSGQKHGLHSMLCLLRFLGNSRMPGSCCNQYKSVWAASFHRTAHMVEQFLNSRVLLLAERFTSNEVTQRPIAFEL